MIRETIVTTRSAAGEAHIAPMGATVIAGGYLLQPFRPSRTLDNLAATGVAAVNFTDDARMFAGCVTRRWTDFALAPAREIDCPRLGAALAHDEVVVERSEDDAQRVKFFCRTVASANHAPFKGLNRARAAVLEGAVLVSRLSLLPDEKIDREMAYLAIAIEKTAGEEEWEAWHWLKEAVAEHRRRRAS